MIRLVAAFALSTAICLPSQANTPVAPGASRAPKVFLLRGFMNIFSLGMDQLAYELQQKGIRADVSNHASWSSVASEAAAECKSGKIGSVILVGHSLGAGAAVDAARQLQQDGVRVALVVTLDPVSTTHAPSNVARLENYYLSNGVGAAVQKDAGFHGKLQNIDLANRPDAGHVAVSRLPDIHKRIIAQISAASGISCR